MKRWWLVILLLLSLGLNLGMLLPRLGGASKEPLDDPPASEQRMPPILRRMANELRLQGETRQTFLSMQHEFFRQTREGREKVGRIQDELRREVVSRNPDRERVDRLLDELASTQAHLERVFVTHLLDSRELLDGRRERQFLRMMQHLRQRRHRDLSEEGPRNRRFPRRFPGAGPADRTE